MSRGWGRLVLILAWALLGLGWALGAGAGGLPEIQVTAPNLRLKYQTLEMTREAARGLQALLGKGPALVRVEVAGDRQSFAARMRELGGPQWAAGLALPRQGLIVLRSPAQLTEPDQFRSLLVHEMGHLYMGHRLGAARAPLWLEEGLSMYLAGQGGLGSQWAMAQAVLGPGLIDLRQLEKSFPSDERRAALAYAQSSYLVGFLVSRHGPQVLGRILEGLAGGRPLTAALHAVTGQGLHALQEDFKEAMESRFSWLAVLSAGGAFWALLALAAGVLLVWRRRGQKKARAAGWGAGRNLEAISRPGARRWPPPAPRGDVLGQAGLKREPPAPGARGPAR